MRSRIPTTCLALVLAGCSPGSDGDQQRTAKARDAVGRWADGDPADPIEAYVVLVGEPAVAALPEGSSVGHPIARAATRKRMLEIEAQHDALRPALLAHGAVVFAELTRLANLFHVRVPRGELDRIAHLPQVLRIEPVPLWQRDLTSAVPVIGVPPVWQSTAPLHGRNIRVGILDSGIDYLHADFGGSGDPTQFEADDPTIVEPGTFPTARVVGGIDIVGNDYNPDGGSSIPAPDADPIDCGGHGSHVAGIAAGGGVLIDGSAYAGPYDLSFDPTAFLVGPGVAPEAQLYAIKVFGCGGPSSHTATGMEWALDPNKDGFFDDRLDVVNASLGSGFGVENPVATVLMESYSAAGGLFVASAGNEGSTFFVTGAPAVADPVLSVAASVDNSLVTFVLHDPAIGAGSFAVAEAQFSPPIAAIGDVTAELVFVDPPHGCSPFTNAGALDGNIAIMDRGNCLFLEKFQFAEAAGAIAVIVINHTFDSAIFTMSPPAGGGTSVLPGGMVSAEDGLVFKNALGLAPATATLSAERFEGAGAELLAGFSSRGPRSEDGALKPEITAPGAGIDSADVGSGTGPSAKSGTSMASPFVTGAAALLREAQPSLGPLDIKALLMNTAATLRNEDGVPYSVSQQGAGRVDVARAVDQKVSARVHDGQGLIAVSFGAITARQLTSEQRDVDVANHGPDSVAYTASTVLTHPRPGISASVEPASFTVAAGETVALTLTLTLDPHALGMPPIDPVTNPTQFDLPRHWLVEGAGLLQLKDQGGHPGADQSLSLPFHSTVRAGALRQAGIPRGCFVPDEPVLLTLDVAGGSAHPAPVTSVFELGVESEVDPALADPLLTRADLRALGVASDAATLGAIRDASVHFGLAVEGEWTTPARGEWFLFTIHIDTDDNQIADYAIVPQAFNREDSWGDVIVGRTYDLSGCDPFDLEDCAPVISKRYLDLVPAGAADTRPYFNSVAVLSVFAADIGLDEDHTHFNYRAVSVGLLDEPDATDWATFDLRTPGLDPARHAPTPGVPLYIGDDPLRVEVRPGVLPKLLVLHHTNVPGTRWQAIDLENYQQPAVSLGHQLPERVPRGRIVHRVAIQNPTTSPMARVDVVATVAGASIELATSSHGACEDGTHCTIEDLDPDEEATITLHLDARDDATTVDVTIDATPDAGCIISVDSSASIEDVPAEDALNTSGGCACRTHPGRDRPVFPPVGPDATWAWWSLACLGLLRLRKRIAARWTGSA